MLLLLSMASVAIMAGGALLNAAAFIGGNYLARFLSGNDSSAALEEKVRHDKALEVYQEAYANIKNIERSCLTGLQPTSGSKNRKSKTSLTRTTPSTFITRCTLTKTYCLQASQSSPISIGQASSKNKAGSCSWALAPLRSVTPPFVFFELFITIPL